MVEEIIVGDQWENTVTAVLLNSHGISVHCFVIPQIKTMTKAI